MTHGFSVVQDRKDIREKTFTCLISDLGQFYSIVVYYNIGNKSVKKITFYDSLKIIPFSVDQVSKAFGLEESKLEIDYNLPREKGHVLTEEERAYIRNDVVIMSKAMKYMFNQKLTHMTSASNSIKNYKDLIGKRKFEHYFPKLPYEIDHDLRQAYKGRIYLCKSLI